MADLSTIEKRKLERMFGMESGYVLGFSNRSFGDFFIDIIGRDVYDFKHDVGSGSKAARLRAFWRAEPNHVVAKVVSALLDHAEVTGAVEDRALLEDCRRIAARLAQSAPVLEFEAFQPPAEDRDFEVVAKQVRDAIDKNEPAAGLDRLHTFTTKFLRTLCEAHGIPVSRDKPLHSLCGEYVRWLRENGHLESEMASRILKSSISVMEAFNEVRNERSLAHDNPILDHEESLLIFNHVAASVRFLRNLEVKITAEATQATITTDDDESPF